jgi:hypothetical protein
MSRGFAAHWRENISPLRAMKIASPGATSRTRS